MTLPKLPLSVAGALTLASGLLALPAGPALAGDPIYLQPGQCILVGGQQVCALGSPQMADLKPRYLYVCRYGMQAGAELTDLKSYSLFQVRVGPDGSKTETMVKSFGPNDKGPCEKEAAKREEDDKKGL